MINHPKVQPDKLVSRSVVDAFSSALDTASSEMKKSVDIKDFDEVLEHIGGWGPFQYLVTLIYFPFNIFLGYVLLSPILTNFTPPHWCKVPELDHLTMEQRKLLAIPLDDIKSGEFSKCTQYLVDWSKVL